MVFLQPGIPVPLALEKPHRRTIWRIRLHESLVPRAVMMMLYALAHRDHASVRHFAFLMLKLDRGVIDAEVMVQAVFYVAEDTLADRGWNVCNRDMAGECVGL